MKLKRSLVGKFILIVGGMLLAFFLIMTLSIQLITEYFISKQIQENIYIQQQKVDQTVNSILYEAITVYSRMFTIENLNSLLDDQVDNKDELYQQIYKDSRISDFYAGIVSIINDQVYTSNDELNLPSYSQIEKVENSTNWIDFCGVIEGKNEKYVLLGKRIINTTHTFNVVGSTYYYLKENVLSQLSSQVVSLSGDSFLVNNSNLVFSHKNNDLVGSTIFDNELYEFERTPNYSIKTINNKRMIVIINSFDMTNYAYNTDWHIVTVIPFNEIYASLNNLRLLIVLITISMLAFAIGVTIKLIKGLLKPINTLSNNLNNFTYDGNYPNIAQKSESDELYQLEKTYDEMIDRIFNLMEKNKEDMETQRKLELDSLQMQINPHFLYNTLDAIAWMAKIKKQPQIEKLVLSLAKFFRISLHKGDKFILVSEEVELIQHFIEIELIRFPNKFEITYCIDEDVKNYQTLKLILQPIVENAIKHGISPITKMGHIEIRSYTDNDDIVYEVIDDGIGFDPPSDILIKSKEKQLQKGGYGLINVNERIKLEYGPNYGLKIESSVGGGTKVIVRIAKRI